MGLDSADFLFGLLKPPMDVRKPNDFSIGSFVRMQARGFLLPKILKTADCADGAGEIEEISAGFSNAE